MQGCTHRCVKDLVFAEARSIEADLTCHSPTVDGVHGEAFAFEEKFKDTNLLRGSTRDHERCVSMRARVRCVDIDPTFLYIRLHLSGIALLCSLHTKLWYCSFNLQRAQRKYKEEVCTRTIAASIRDPTTSSSHRLDTDNLSSFSSLPAASDHLLVDFVL